MASSDISSMSSTHSPYSVHRILSLATALPANSSSIALTLQALKDGGEGLKWVLAGTSSVVSFANRNVVLPALRKVGATSSASSRDDISADSLVHPELRFSQSLGRRSAPQHMSCPTTSPRPTRASFDHSRVSYSLRPASPCCSGGGSQQQDMSCVVSDDEGVETVHRMHMGLQASLL